MKRPDLVLACGFIETLLQVWKMIQIIGQWPRRSRESLQKPLNRQLLICHYPRHCVVHYDKPRRRV